MLALLTDDNAQGQYYLTDVIGLLVKGGGKAIPPPRYRPLIYHLAR
jgi:bifunctional N-acetylglucosamine-1-phosphate-uridyltransferase/glucosamine-1-phosphate-acetyltransferase GlmU-like protein